LPELLEVIGGTKRKIYFQATVCRRCVLSALRTVKLGLSEVGNQANTLMFSEKKIVFHTNLEQMFKSTTTNIDTQQTTTQQRLRCRLKNATLLHDNCCCLSKKGMRSSSESTSHSHLQRSLDWTGWANS